MNTYLLGKMAYDGPVNQLKVHQELDELPFSQDLFDHYLERYLGSPKGHHFFIGGLNMLKLSFTSFFKNKCLSSSKRTWWNAVFPGARYVYQSF